MKRLLIISNMYPSPDAPYFGVFVQRQVAVIESLGIECVLAVACGRAGSPVAALRKYAGLTRDAMRAARQSQPDAIIAHYAFPTGLIGLAAAKRSRGNPPVAVVVHGGDVEPAKRTSAATRAGTRAALSRADLVVAVSRAVAADAAALGASTSRTTIANMGYDDALFVAGDRAAARMKLGLSAEHRYAVLVGNLIERKGVATLIEAASIAKAQHGALRWIVVGGGAAAPWRAAAARAGVEELVTFPGPARPEDVPVWLAAADVAVVPSLREPLGVAALEALACGTPVVASRTGGLAEIITVEKTGLLVPPGDAEALAEAVGRLLQNEPLRIQLSEAGIVAAGEQTVLRQTQIMLEAIERAIERLIRAGR